MKILIVGNYIYSEQQSMLRFAELMKTILISEGHEAIVLQPTTILGNLKPSNKGFGKWLGYIDRFILFRFTLKRKAKKVDIVHICDHSNAMYAKWIKNKPVIVTCHDLMAIQSALGMVDENSTGFTGKLLQKWIVSGLKNCNHVICVSKNTQDELIKTISIPKEKTSIAYNALNYPYSPMNKEESLALIKEYLPNTQVPFFFHLGGNQWYKNRQGVAVIFSYLLNYPKYQNHLLIMAGKPLPDTLRAKIEALGINNKVIEVNNLTNEEIRAFYSTTEAMIFPSLQEGFGWPIAEAQACGAKVVTSNRAPMTEVGGDAAIYIEPDKPLMAAEHINDILQNSSGLTQKAINNAKRFSQKSMLEAYISGYKSIMSSHNFKKVNV